MLEQRQLLTGGPPVFTTGDVLVGVTGGIQWRHADGSLVSTLPITAGQSSTGMAFDQAGNLYATGFLMEQINRFNPSGTSLGTFGSGFNKNPESIVFDAAGNAYVGQSDGGRLVLKLNADGHLIDSYPVQIESRGSDWIELAADQRTLYYTSEGHTIKRYDLVTRQQLPDFATGLPGDEAFQLQLLADGSVLVADDHWIFRFGEDGKIDTTYGYNPANQWFNLVLDPDGTSFWSSDQGNGRIARFDIATGKMLESFTSDPGGAFGLAVVGEPRAATAASLSLTTVAATTEMTVGQTATYTVQATNLGPGTAANTFVTFTLPAGATLVAGSSSLGGSSVVQSGVAMFYLGNLAGGTSATATLVLSANAPGLLTSLATAWTDSPNVVTTTKPMSVALTTKVTAQPPVVTSTFLMSRGRWGCCTAAGVVINFSQDMSLSQTQNVRNYYLSGPFSNQNLAKSHRRSRTVAIRTATYNPLTRSVTLITRQPISLRWVYQLTISAGLTGLVSNTGIALAGQSGQAGTDYTGYVKARATASRRLATFTTYRAHPMAARVVR
jgi:uncharacterized repeat protein (TIGR01451 family)